MENDIKMSVCSKFIHLMQFQAKINSKWTNEIYEKRKKQHKRSIKKKIKAGGDFLGTVPKAGQ